jgi:hypothetical protein
MHASPPQRSGCLDIQLVIVGMARPSLKTHCWAKSENVRMAVPLFTRFEWPKTRWAEFLQNVWLSGTKIVRQKTFTRRI